MSRTSKKKSLIVYTDGSCVGNGKTNAAGGIGIHFPNGELADVSKIYSAGYCTNQKTELYAILTALRYIKQRLGLINYKVIVKTDSEYSINCVTKWVYGWIKNGWKTKNNRPVANKEYIEAIHNYYENYDIMFEHVDAHTGLDDFDSVANARADELATKATKKSMSNGPSKKNFHHRKISYGSKKPVHGITYNSEKQRSPMHVSTKPKILTKLAKNSNFVVELIKSKN
jgi:ribonuclease HI